MLITTIGRITKEEAQELHTRYMEEHPGDNEVHAVLIDLEETFSKTVQESEELRSIHNLIRMTGFNSLACYFGKYGDVNDQDKNHRNTIIVQLANTVNGDVTVIENAIYNFGGAKPPKPVIDQQIEWPLSEA